MFGEKREMMMKRLAVIAILGCFGSTSYCGVIYSFEIFTDNGLYNGSTGFYMDVDNGGSLVDFTFYNDSTVQSSITNIYFDDGTLLGATQSITNGSGTDFAEDGPGNLPSGNEYPGGFNADREFNIGALPPPPANGVNNTGAGEWVTIEFELVGGTFQDVLDELDSGVLKVGIHIQDFPDGSSESAVHVPEPTTILLLGLGGLALIRKRRA